MLYAIYAVIMNLTPTEPVWSSNGLNLFIFPEYWSTIAVIISVNQVHSTETPYSWRFEANWHFQQIIDIQYTWVTGLQCEQLANQYLVISTWRKWMSSIQMRNKHQLIRSLVNACVSTVMNASRHTHSLCVVFVGPFDVSWELVVLYNMWIRHLLTW